MQSAKETIDFTRRIITSKNTGANISGDEDKDNDLR